MDSQLPFTNNFRDLSTERGYQFEFRCARCGDGHRSAFAPNVLNTASGVAQVAGSLLGGFVGRAARSAPHVQRLAAGPAHDAALRAAVAEIAPQFSKCNRCGEWVCRRVCWNGERDQCARCSPKMDQELAALESQGTLDQLSRRVRDGSIDLAGGASLSSAAAGQQSTGALRPCGECGAPIPRAAKFCTECGKPAALKHNCPQCGVESGANAKFCGHCGEPLPS